MPRRNLSPSALASTRHLGRHHRSIAHALLAVSLACAVTACGDSGGGGGKDAELIAPGYAVDCTPDIPDDSLVCISQADWSCAQRGFYVRESICAKLLGGTPKDYDGKPKVVKYQGLTELDCADPPEGLLFGWEGLDSCDDCRVCGNQLYGWNSKQQPDEESWNEWKFCPDSYEELAAPGGLCEDAAPDDSPTTGNDEGTGIWKCTNSWTISGTMTDNNPPVSQDVSSMSPPGVPDCVNATDESIAQDSCFDLCEFKDSAYVKEDENSEAKSWDPFPCADLYNFTPVEALDASECHLGTPMWMTVPTPFTARANLTIGDATASSDQLSGLMEFTIGACPADGGPCDVSLTALVAGTRTIHGDLDMSATKSLPFTVSDLEVQMLQPVLGELNPVTGVVTFPGKDLFVTISTGVTSLDGMPVSSGLDRKLIVIEDAAGRWNGRQLSLDLNWRSREASLSVQVTGG